MRRFASNFEGIVFNGPVVELQQLELYQLAVFGFREVAVVQKQQKAGRYSTTLYDVETKRLYRATHQGSGAHVLKGIAALNPNCRHLRQHERALPWERR